jgi:hypothetical protein
VAFLASYQETPRILRDLTSYAPPASLQDALLAALRAERRR